MNEQATTMNQQKQQQMMNMNQSLMSMNQQQMVQMNRSYGMWPPSQQFRNPNSNPGAMKPPPSGFNKSLAPRNNWKGKKVNKPNDKRRTEQQNSLIRTGGNGNGNGGVNIISGGNLNFKNFNPPTLNELQHQNRLKTRKFFPKKKFNKNMNISGNNSRSAPFAPRNTTSFIIRSKKSGGIAPLVSPYPVTPAVLPTPILSPSRELLVDMAKEEWGVDGYGSMKGLIRLRSPGQEMDGHDDDEEDEGGSSGSDVEEHVEVERRLDHDLSRFEMIYNPNSVNVGGVVCNNVLENRVDDQDSHIAQLEEENLILKERLFLMERELGDLRSRMMCLERIGNGGEVINEEVVENESDNESDSRGGESHSVEENNEFNEETIRGDNCDNVADKNNSNNNSTDVESKEESKNDDDELIGANKSEKNIADMNDDKNYEDRCVDEEVKIKDNVDGECCEDEMVGDDVCMLEDGVGKDYIDAEKDAAN